MKSYVIQANFLIAIVLLLSACEYQKLPEPYYNPYTGIDTTGMSDTATKPLISFIKGIIPRFQERCAVSDCHDGVTSATMPISPFLDSINAYNELWSGGYIDTANPENSLLYESILPGGEMYEYATDADRATILEWIKEGALNN